MINAALPARAVRPAKYRGECEDRSSIRKNGLDQGGVIRRLVDQLDGPVRHRLYDTSPSGFVDVIGRNARRMRPRDRPHADLGDLIFVQMEHFEHHDLFSATMNYSLDVGNDGLNQGRSRALPR